MLVHIAKKNQGNFIDLASHPRYINKEPPDRVQRSEEGHNKEIRVEKVFDKYEHDSKPIGAIYIIIFLGKSYADFA